MHELLNLRQHDQARQRLLGRTRDLLRSAAAFWAVLDPDQQVSAAPDPAGGVRVDVCGLDDWQLALWQEPFFDQGEIRDNPLWEVMQRAHGRLRTARRADQIPDDQWTAHPQHAFAHELGFDDEVASMVPVGGGHECVLVVSRATGDRPFGERERLLLHALQGSLRSVYPRLIEPSYDADGRPRPAALREALAPRFRAVLDQLLTGRSEKEIALVLGLSGRTVHKYVEGVYAAARVSSRPELMALFVPRLDLGGG